MSDRETHGWLSSEKVRSASRRGIAINYSAQGIKFVLQFVYSVLLARILLPEDFGTVAMVGPIIGFAALLSDIGFSQAVIQREIINRPQLSFLFWANLGLTVIVAFILSGLAELVSNFYGEPTLRLLVIAFSGALVLGSLSTIHSSLLNRRLAFGTLAILELGTFFFAALIGLLAAWAGFGVWAIVINLFAINFISAVALWILVPWRPNHPLVKVVGSRELASFGGNIAISNIANYFARNLDNVLIGKVWGSGSLGYYDRAYKLLLLPLTQVMAPIAKVALPLLSRLQNDSDSYRKSYCMMLELVILITYPGSIFAFVCHSELILNVLGPQWASASPIFAVFAIGALFAPISHSVNWLLISQNRTPELRTYGIFSSLGFSAAIVVGMPWGALGVATSYMCFGVVQGPILWRLATRRGIVSTGLLAKSLSPYVFAGLPTGVAIFCLQTYMPAGLTSLALLGFFSYVSFLILLLVQPRSRNTFLLIITEAQRLFLLRRSSAS